MLEAAYELDCHLAVARVYDDREAVLSDQGGEGVARQRMVVDDEDAHDERHIGRRLAAE